MPEKSEASRTPPRDRDEFTALSQEANVIYHFASPSAQEGGGLDGHRCSQRFRVQGDNSRNIALHLSHSAHIEKSLIEAEVKRMTSTRY
jgi:hypothetical protein